MKIINVFRIDTTNSGDWHSPPFRYFPELGSNTLEATDKKTIPEQSLVVIGGGGLISPKPAFQHIRRLFKKNICIGWGLGENQIDNKNSGYLSPDTPQLFPSWLQDFDLIGLRDKNSPHQHIPCASCLHPAFDNPAASKYEIGFYLHKRIPLPVGNFPYITNDGNNIEEKINFIAQCEVIISNSYHGVYWAMLLNKKVICCPFGTKFFGLHNQLRHCPPWNIEMTNLDELISHDNYLQQCRKKNITFSKKVLELINN